MYATVCDPGLMADCWLQRSALGSCSCRSVSSWGCCL